MGCQGSYMTGGLLTQAHEWRNVSLFVGGIGGIVLSTYLYTAFNDANKQRRHKRALAEVSKYQ